MQVLVTIELKDSYKSLVKETMESELPPAQIKQAFDAAAPGWKFKAPEVDINQTTVALDGMAELLTARFLAAVKVQHRIEADQVRSKNLDELNKMVVAGDIMAARDAATKLVELGIVPEIEALDVVPWPEVEAGDEAEVS